tara:strand:+ start:1996 stop:2898 length:903 start_codon:yes stop_codon:yes gene_type:complete
MRLLSTIFSLSTLLFFASSCQNKGHEFDASGSFEAEETIISAEANGLLQSFNLREGQDLKPRQIVGHIDSLPLSLKKQQLLAQMAAMESRRPNKALQLAPLQSQLKTAKSEQDRINKLKAGGAATAKQADDIAANISALSKQIAAQESSLNIAVNSLEKELKQMQVQVAQVDDQLKRCVITNPVKGKVLSKYAEQYEMTAAGKPLYKIADLSQIILRSYVSGNQLPQVKLNQKVTVYTDNGEGGFNEREGEIVWISDQSEFTPKTIQTKDERANMVYALKVLVRNDGRYKIGMYGEIKFL